MDAVSYAHSAKQAQRIEKFIENPDSTSGILTQPRVIEAGETVTIKSGRQAILANTVIDGDLVIEAGADVFVPAGAGFSDLDQRIDRLETLQIGAILNGYTIFDNCIVAFGGEFNRADYPKLWAYLQANSFVATEANWQAEAAANSGICGVYSTGNGTTTFRVPNLDNAFLRAANRGVGTYQRDSFQGHHHYNNITQQAIYQIGISQGGMYIQEGYAPITRDPISDGINGTPRTSYETRPINIAVLPLIVAK